VNVRLGQAAQRDTNGDGMSNDQQRGGPGLQAVCAQSVSFNSEMIARCGDALLTVPRLPQANIVVADLEALWRGRPAPETMP
jgi:hypothetical protein